MKLNSERMIEARAKACQTMGEVDDTDAWVHGHMYGDVFMACTPAKVWFCDQRSLKRVAGEAEAQTTTA